jgi:hypothetical protein
LLLPDDACPIRCRLARDLLWLQRESKGGGKAGMVEEGTDLFLDE